jgi:hypothetical protein
VTSNPETCCMTIPRCTWLLLILLMSWPGSAETFDAIVLPVDDPPASSSAPADNPDAPDDGRPKSPSNPADKTPTDADGKPHGLWIIHHPNGQEKRRARYTHGRLQGNLTRYDGEGNLLEKTRYLRGERHGPRQLYRAGQLVDEQEWVRGQLLFPHSRRFVRKQVADILRWKPPRDVDHPELYTRQSLEGLRQTMLYRFLCGLPWKHLRLDPAHTRYARAAADLCKRIGRIDHHPPNPGMSKDAYDTAHHGTSHSNLHMHSQGVKIPRMVHGFMDDSDPKNIQHVGHRRWILAPTLGRIGFGTDGDYGAMYVVDKSGPDQPGWPEEFDYDFVVFPPAGYFPAKLFKPHIAWHVSPNPGRYSLPAENELKVTIRPARRRELDAPNPPKHKPLTLNYKIVSLKNTGAGPAIIFRPAGLVLRPGAIYRVTLEGLRKNARPVTLEYVVAFQ